MRWVRVPKIAIVTSRIAAVWHPVIREGSRWPMSRVSRKAGLLKHKVWVTDLKPPALGRVKKCHRMNAKQRLWSRRGQAGAVLSNTPGGCSQQWGFRSWERKYLKARREGGGRRIKCDTLSPNINASLQFGFDLGSISVPRGWSNPATGFLGKWSVPEGISSRAAVCTAGEQAVALEKGVCLMRGI